VWTSGQLVYIDSTYLPQSIDQQETVETSQDFRVAAARDLMDRPWQRQS